MVDPEPEGRLMWWGLFEHECECGRIQKGDFGLAKNSHWWCPQCGREWYVDPAGRVFNGKAMQYWRDNWRDNEERRNSVNTEIIPVNLYRDGRVVHTTLMKVFSCASDEKPSEQPKKPTTVEERLTDLEQRVKEIKQMIEDRWTIELEVSKYNDDDLK